MGDRISEDLTQEEKFLLQQDLSGRLPYGVKLQINNVREELLSVHGQIINGYYSIKDVKPYLRPLESITEEEERELYKKYNCEFVGKRLYRVRYHSEGYWDSDTEVSRDDYVWVIDWFNRHHFDYRGLISKGLAIEAPPGLY